MSEKIGPTGEYDHGKAIIDGDRGGLIVGARSTEFGVLWDFGGDDINFLLSTPEESLFAVNLLRTKCQQYNITTPGTCPYQIKLNLEQRVIAVIRPDCSRTALMSWPDTLAYANTLEKAARTLIAARPQTTPTQIRSHGAKAGH